MIHQTCALPVEKTDRHHFWCLHGGCLYQHQLLKVPCVLLLAYLLCNFTPCLYSLCLQSWKRCWFLLSSFMARKFNPFPDPKRGKGRSVLKQPAAVKPASWKKVKYTRDLLVSGQLAYAWTVSSGKEPSMSCWELQTTRSPTCFCRTACSVRGRAKSALAAARVRCPSFKRAVATCLSTVAMRKLAMCTWTLITSIHSLWTAEAPAQHPCNCKLRFCFSCWIAYRILWFTDCWVWATKQSRTWTSGYGIYAWSGCRNRKHVSFGNGKKRCDVEADETTFLKQNLGNHASEPETPVIWEPWCGIVKRGCPQSLVLHRPNPKMSEARALGPGAIRKVEWVPLAKTWLQDKQVILHTDAAKSYKCKVPGVIHDNVIHAKKRVKKNGKWQWRAPNYVRVVKHKIPGTKKTMKVKAGAQTIDRAWRYLKDRISLHQNSTL